MEGFISFWRDYLACKEIPYLEEEFHSLCRHLLVYGGILILWRDSVSFGGIHNLLEEFIIFWRDA